MKKFQFSSCRKYKVNIASLSFLLFSWYKLFIGNHQFYASIKSHLNGNKRANNPVHFVTIVILSLLLVRIWWENKVSQSVIGAVVGVHLGFIVGWYLFVFLDLEVRKGQRLHDNVHFVSKKSYLMVTFMRPIIQLEPIYGHQIIILAM